MNEAIVLLLLLWAMLLLPGAVRSRSSSPHTTVGGFARAMDVLRAKPGQGRELMVPGDAGRIVTHGISRDSVASPGVDDTAVRAWTGSEADPRSAAAHGEDPLIARRRSWFLRLLAAVGVSLLLAVAFGGWLWVPFTMVVLVTGGYVALLRHLKLQQEQARQVVRDLQRRRPVEPRPAEDPGRADGTDGMAVGTVRLRRWDG